MSENLNGVRLVSSQHFESNTTALNTEPLLSPRHSRKLSATNGAITGEQIGQSSNTLREPDYFDYSSPASTFSAPQGSASRLPNPSRFSENNMFSQYPVSPPHKMLMPRTCTVSRRSRHFVPNEYKDEYYWQKRRKNNEAARKSREKRKTIDNVLEEKVLVLSHENEVLRQELYLLKVKYGEIESEPLHSNQRSKFVNKCPPLLIESKHSLPSFSFDPSSISNQELLEKPKMEWSQIPPLMQSASSDLSPTLSIKSPGSVSSQITPPLEHSLPDPPYPLDLKQTNNSKIVHEDNNVLPKNNSEASSLPGFHEGMNKNFEPDGNNEAFNSNNIGISFLSKIASGKFYLSPIDLSQKNSEKFLKPRKNCDTDNKEVKVSSPTYEAANALVNLREGHSPSEDKSPTHAPLTAKLSNGSGDGVTSLPHKLRFKQTKSS